MRLDAAPPTEFKRSVLLGVQPFMQPSPTKNPGGDCFACATTAMLHHLYPERPPSFEQVWDYWLQEDRGHGRTLANTWYFARQAFYNGHRDGYRVEVMSDFVQPRYDPERGSHPWWNVIPEFTWARRLEAFLCAGWVAFAFINVAGSGPFDAEMRFNSPDHFVLIDGIGYADEVLSRDESGKPRSWRTTEWVHVVCSAKGAYWIRVSDLLVKHGASALWLVRRGVD